VSEHDDRMAAVGVPQRFARQGRSAVYTPQDGSGAVPLTGIPGPLRDDDRHEVSHGVAEGTSLTWTIGRDPDDADYGGVAEPVRNDTITVDGVVWLVDGRDAQTPSTTTLRLKRVGRSEASRTAFAG